MILKHRKHDPSNDTAMLEAEPIDPVLELQYMFEDGDELVYTAMRESMSALYHSVSTRDANIVMEGLKDLAKSAWQFFKDVASKIWNFIKNSFDYITSFFQDFEKFIESHKDNIFKFKEFDVQGFAYDIKKTEVDNCGIRKIIDNYNTQVSKLKDGDLSDVQKYISKEYNKDTMNEIRGKVSGAGKSIKADNFKNELEKMYRGGKPKATITVNVSKLNEMINTWKQYKDIIKEVKEDGNSVQSFFDDASDFFRSMPNYEYDTNNEKKINKYRIGHDKDGFTKDDSGSDEYNSDLYKRQTALYNFCFKMTRDIGSIYTVAYTTKVAMLKEAMGFYKGVIRRALSPFADTKKDGDKK